MTRNADEFFKVGCGRCALGGTLDCKVHRWAQELALLRSWCLQAGLKEECKWGVPVYTLNGRMVVMVSALKESCVLGFVNAGDRLEDPKGLLVLAGPHSVRDRVIRWTSLADLAAAEEAVRDLIRRHASDWSAKKAAVSAGQALSAGAGQAVSAGSGQAGVPAYPQELKDLMAQRPDFAAAFEALTPGRRRGYLIFLTGAAQSSTRARRAASIIPKVLAGKGLQEG